MSKAIFIVAYILYCEEGGHKYDLGEILWSWQQYKNNNERYEYLNKFGPRAEKIVTS